MTQHERHYRAIQAVSSFQLVVVGSAGSLSSS